MTTFAAQSEADRLRAELAARRRSAWRDYHEAVRDLQGREYEDIESAAWDQLQATLNELDAEAALATTPGL